MNIIKSMYSEIRSLWAQPYIADLSLEDIEDAKTIATPIMDE